MTSPDPELAELAAERKRLMAAYWAKWATLESNRGHLMRLLESASRSLHRSSVLLGRPVHLAIPKVSVKRGKPNART